MSTIVRLLEDSVAKRPDNAFIHQKEGQEWRITTYRQTLVDVLDIAAGLISLGFRPGEKLALLSENRKLWIEGELGILFAGCVSVPLSIKLEEPDLKFRLNHSETRGIIVSAGQADKITNIRESLPGVEFIILLDEQETYAADELSMARVIELGRELLARDPEAVERVKSQVRPEDYANISYTSGTSADPKGVLLTHGNYYSNMQQAADHLIVPEDYIQLVILPMDHAFAHAAGIYLMMYMCASLAIVQTGRSPMEMLRNIPINMQEVRPHVLLSVPALAKNFQANILKGIREKGKLASFLFGQGLKLAYAYNGNGHDRGRGLRALLKPLVSLFDGLLFAKVRKAFGGRIQYIVGGGAYLDADIQRFFMAVGLPIYQGYGLTETTPMTSCNIPGKVKFGSSGRPIPRVKVRIVNEACEDLPAGQKGEVLIQGANVMHGYWKNPKATSEAIRNGWLHTGDMGYLDAEGYLYVLGRFKSLLIGMDGEKYSPEGIEESMAQHSEIIEQVLLHNNQNPYTTALVVVNFDRLKEKLKEMGVSIKSPDAMKKALELIHREVNMFKSGGRFAGMFPERWLPSAYAIVEEAFTQENGLLNSTMKVVRREVEKRYSECLQYLFTLEGKSIENPLNIKVLKSRLT
ncbi:MAG: long-chain fatty acid--CoA ligase [Bacteroidia bacterium]|nr:MAG: long-chain fatty acid--CoA ligase [Bacteroidia bacterium]